MSGYSVTWGYAGVILMATLVGVALLRRSQRALPLSWWQRLAIGCGAFCGAMLGAKLPFLFTDWEQLASGRAWWTDGKTIVFGLAGGYFGVELAKWTLELRVKTGDSYVVPVAMAVAIGRLGCFMAGCCFGKPTALPWGVDFGDGPRHPTQLYEMAFHLAAAGAISGLAAWGWFRWQRFKLYLLAYMAFRLVTEWLRPEVVQPGGLTFYQWSIVALAPVLAWLWWRDARQLSQLGASDPLPGRPGNELTWPAESD